MPAFPGGISTAVARVPSLESTIIPGNPVIPGNPIFGQAPAAQVIEHLFHVNNDRIDLLGPTRLPGIDFHLG